MKSHLAIAMAASLFAGTLSAPAPAKMASPETLSTLRGTYNSTGAESWYGGFGHRGFVFADGNWNLTFTHALDPEMALRTFQFRTGGSYTVSDPSADITGPIAGSSTKTGNI